jgi:hypothetical protein
MDLEKQETMSEQLIERVPTRPFARPAKSRLGSARAAGGRAASLLSSVRGRACLDVYSRIGHSARHLFPSVVHVLDI